MKHRTIVFILLLLISSMYCISLPFNIPGPKSLNDKIAIVGAGPSGVHMAYLLKSKGFKNIEILEKTKSIGGKSLTIKYRGASQEMGTVYLSHDYEENVIELVNKYTPGDLVNLPLASVWLDTLPGPITYQQYIGMCAMKHFQIKNKKYIGIRLVQNFMKYIKIHHSIFGKYEGELMPQPSEEKMDKIKGTFFEFLQRNSLLSLLPVFKATTTIQGYGHLDEIAAFYGLMWNTPKLMRGFLGRMIGKTKGKTGVYMLRSGFQNLWKTIVAKENIKVTFEVDIYRMFRAFDRKCNDVWVYKRTGNKKPRWEHYDFIIWSPEMKETMSRWRNKITSEQRLFQSTKPTFFTTSIVDSITEARGYSPIDYWVNNIDNKIESSVWAQRDSYSALRGYTGFLYKNGSFPTGDDNKQTKTTIVYQMSNCLPKTNHLKNTLIQHFLKFGSTNVNIIKMKTWRYFPRYSPIDVEKGYLWKILKMQGKYGMWYIGSSISFESIKSVMEYNKLLVRNMDVSGVDNN